MIKKLLLTTFLFTLLISSVAALSVHFDDERDCWKFTGYNRVYVSGERVPGWCYTPGMFWFENPLLVTKTDVWLIDHNFMATLIFEATH